MDRCFASRGSGVRIPHLHHLGTSGMAGTPRATSSGSVVYGITSFRQPDLRDARQLGGARSQVSAVDFRIGSLVEWVIRDYCGNQFKPVASFSQVLPRIEIKIINHSLRLVAFVWAQAPFRKHFAGQGIKSEVAFRALGLGAWVDVAIVRPFSAF